MENKLDFSLDRGDIGVIVVSLLATTIVGLYYGRKEKGDTNEASYLGAKNMGIVPITFSLVASFTTSFAMIVFPAEVISYGTGTAVSSLTTAAVGAWFCIYVLVPVMYDLDIYSLFDYFERRFDRKVKYFSTLLFIFTSVAVNAVIGMLPGVVLQQFTGIYSTYLSVSLLAISTIATTYGGFSGVIWMDTLQCSIMYLSTVIIIFKSIAKSGGFTEVWTKSYEGGRLGVSFLELDPTVRISVWTYVSFAIFAMISIGGYQSMFQRIKALPTLRDAQRSCFWTFIGCHAYTLTALMGMAAYAYYDCDLLAIKIANSQIDTVVIFINEIGRDIFLFRGWFLAAVICSTVSSQTTNINTIGAMIYVDIVRPFNKIPEKHVVLTIRLMNMLAGLATSILILSFKEGMAVELFLSVTSASVGVSAAHFFLGLFAVNCNGTGALWGGIVSYVIICFVSIMNRWLIIQGKLPVDKPLDPRIEGCPGNFTLNEVPFPAGDIPVIFRISRFSYTAFSTALTIIISLSVSWFTGGNKRRRLPKNLFSSYVHRYIKDPNDEGNETEFSEKFPGLKEKSPRDNDPVKNIVRGTPMELWLKAMAKRLL